MVPIATIALGMNLISMAFDASASSTGINEALAMLRHPEKAPFGAAQIFQICMEYKKHAKDIPHRNELIQALRDSLKRKHSDEVKILVAKCLVALDRDEESIELLSQKACNKECPIDLRLLGLEAFFDLGCFSQKLFVSLSENLKDSDIEVRYWSVKALHKITPRRGMYSDRLSSGLLTLVKKEKDTLVKVEALNVIIHRDIGDKRVSLTLKQLLNTEKIPALRTILVIGLSKYIHEGDARDMIIAGIRDRDTSVALTSLDAVIRSGYFDDAIPTVLLEIKLRKDFIFLAMRISHLGPKARPAAPLLRAKLMTEKDVDILDPEGSAVESSEGNSLHHILRSIIKRIEDDHE
jgi:hypothetical protein